MCWTYVVFKPFYNVDFLLAGLLFFSRFNRIRQMDINGARLRMVLTEVLTGYSSFNIWQF